MFFFFVENQSKGKTELPLLSSNGKKRSAFAISPEFPVERTRKLSYEFVFQI